MTGRCGWLGTRRCRAVRAGAARSGQRHRRSARADEVANGTGAAGGNGGASARGAAEVRAVPQARSEAPAATGARGLVELSPTRRERVAPTRPNTGSSFFGGLAGWPCRSESRRRRRRGGGGSHGPVPLQHGEWRRLHLFPDRRHRGTAVPATGRAEVAAAAAVVTASLSLPRILHRQRSDHRRERRCRRCRRRSRRFRRFRR